MHGAPSRGVGPATEPYLDENGHIALPEGTNLSALLEKNIVDFADALAYRYVEYSQEPDGKRRADLGPGRYALARDRRPAAAGDVEWRSRRDLCPQGLDYVTGFFGAIQAGNIAVPLFAPELPGHAERLDAVLDRCQPAVVLTTTAVGDAVQKFVRLMPREKRPRIIAVDAIPDTVGVDVRAAGDRSDEIAYLHTHRVRRGLRPASRSVTAPRERTCCRWCSPSVLRVPSTRSTASAGCRCTTTWA